MSDTLFSTQRITSDESHNAPVIAVGLPRSGSSFLSHVLSAMNDWYVFDDLYLQDKAKELGASAEITPDKFDALLYYLGWQIRARHRHGIYAIPKVEQDEVDSFNAALKSTFQDEKFNWLDLQKEWMVRLAERSNCKNWGYKLPKAFYSLPLLRRHYPDMKIIYLLRHPCDVLKSFKFITPDNQDGHPGRYHPLFYAIYWRLAAASYHREKAKNPDQVCLVLFDNLTQSPTQTGEALAKFLNTELDPEFTPPERVNTSFKTSGKRSNLNGFEHFLVNLICGQQMDKLGFERRYQRFRISDLGDFCLRTVNFVRFKLSVKRN